MMGFQPPSTGGDEAELLADWLELCLLFGVDRELPRSEVEDYLADDGPLGTPNPGSSEDYSDELDFSARDAVRRLVDDIFRIISRRHVNRPWYPVQVRGDRVQRSSEWNEVPAHVLFLIFSLSPHYSNAAIAPSSRARLLFEHVTSAALEALVGKSIVVGTGATPSADGQEEHAGDAKVSRIRRALETICGTFGLEMKATDKDLKRTDQDLGLDVLSRFSIGDHRPGGLYLLTQCATGKTWHEEKRGEPAQRLWDGLVGWDGMRASAVATPMRVDDELAMCRYCLRMGGVILDRDRLMAGNPDSQLAPEAKKELASWCQAHIGKFPSASGADA